MILPTGVVRKDFREVDGARQPGRPPKLQISWLEADPTTGEVDVDYRPFDRSFKGVIREIIGRGHFDPNNSNVMARLPFGPSHYSLHLERYGPGLVQWWD